MPEYEEREAARFGLYTWAAWSELPHAERVAGVAHYRLHYLIELHMGEAVAAASRRAANQARAQAAQHR